MLVSEKITCISAYSSRGCSRPRFGSNNGSESSFTSFPQGSLSVSSKRRPSFPGPHTASPIAIAHIPFVRIKSLSVNNILLEYSFGKLKYDSTTLPMSGFLGSLPIFASRSPVSRAILNFFY